MLKLNGLCCFRKIIIYIYIYEIIYIIYKFVIGGNYNTTTFDAF